MSGGLKEEDSGLGPGQNLLEAEYVLGLDPRDPNSVWKIVKGLLSFCLY